MVGFQACPTIQVADMVSLDHLQLRREEEEDMEDTLPNNRLPMPANRQCTRLLLRLLEEEEREGT